MTGISGTTGPGDTGGRSSALPPEAHRAQSDAHDDAGQAPSTRRLVALSDPQPVSGYATVGVTWKHGADVRRRPDRRPGAHQKNGTWSGWMDAEYHDEHGPDAGSAEEACRRPAPRHRRPGDR